MASLPATAILWPAVAMAGLTFLVWIRLYHLRLGEMMRKRIDAQALAGSADAARLLSDTRASDNFRNLFEVPVLFYALVAVALATRVAPPWLVAGAWAFVALRVLHSLIHCTYNRVMHRLAAFLAGFALLASLWVAFFLTLRAGGSP